MRPQDGGPQACTKAASPRPRMPLGLDPFELSVMATPAAVGTARAAVTAWIGATISDAMLIDVLLLVSELVTNSIRHADAPVDAPISVRAGVRGDLLRLEVGDAGLSGTIARRAPDGGRAGGYGLNLVHRLSRRWGVDREIGTRVWAELALHPAR
jgi:anti-sigma regulatory factor (Ser/Thr protein kinase)